MNIFSKKLAFILLSAAVFAVGCSKKPRRPEPSATILGPDGAGASRVGQLNPNEIGTFDSGLIDPSASQLEPRADGAIEIGDQIRNLLQSVYFDFDQSAIRPSERSKLQEAQRHLSANPGHRILLEGHCDWRGTSEYNLGLGDRRAGAARQYLESLGVASSRIETLSKGDLEAVENGTSEQMSRDRRVELVVLKK